MAEPAYPNLRNAPILEGLIHLQVKSGPGISIEEVRAFANKVGDSYKVSGELRNIQSQFVLKQGAPPASKPIQTTLEGLRLERQDPPFVIHAKAGELLVSRLKPYDRWEELVTEARRVWALFSYICKPELVTRVATRFVNQLELPIEGLQLENYFTAPIAIPRKLPQLFDHFITRVVIPDAATGVQIAIAQASGDPNHVSKTLPIVLDVDVYKADLELAVDSEEIWGLLGKMREIKNKAFFGSLTERAIELLS